MNNLTEIHPDTVLESLLAKGGREPRRATLSKLNELCRKRHEKGERNFTIPVIGRLIEAEGIMKGRALYNAPSADYRTLIEAWSAYAGPALPKPAKILASAEFLRRIDDPAIRAIMQAVIAERDKLKAQINVLKAHTNVVVDRRPIVHPTFVDGVLLGSTALLLTPLEREALVKAILPEYLEERGLRLGSHGEILNERGRTIFEVGFARAIAKILGGADISG